MNSYSTTSDQHKPERCNLTLNILGLDWSKYFPLTLGPKCQVRIIELDTAMQFFESKYQGIYGTNNGPFRADPNHRRKHLYYHFAGDFFGFFHNADLIGIFIGTIIDWSSYYFRNCSIVPEHQGQGYYQTLLLHLMNTLCAHGIERVEGDVAPSNLGHIHTLNKLKFNITGISLSDRWGSMLHFTKFLKLESESTFLTQFCHGIKHQLEERGNL